MALAVRECTLALVFITTWLLIKANLDVCPEGDVTAMPSQEISLGSAINISCSLKNNISATRLILYKNKKEIASHRGDSISAPVTDLPLGKTVFDCKLVSANTAKRHVCGVEVSVGVVPEQPQNLSCEQKGENGTVACMWSPGRDTHLNTNYMLQLNGPKNLTLQKHCNGHYCKRLDLEASLTPELPESMYTAKITATNRLGNSSSLLSTFTFSDIVRPLPPWDIRISFLNASSSRCTLQWKDEGWVLLNRLRYRPHSSRFWNMVNITNAQRKHDLLDLKPFTEYEFQISSKLHLYQGSWSEWSESLRVQTPEAEPTGTLDVWYTKQYIDYNRQQISVFWKNLSMSEARGQMLCYRITLQEVTGKKITLQNITSHTSWTWVIPRNGTWTVAVSAVNSRGSSLPTRIEITDLCSTGSLTPHKVSANSEDMKDIVVAWQPPRNATSAVQEYVVEWKLLHPEASMQSPLNWLRVPSYNVSALISENIKPYVCYEIRVHALSEGGRGCSCVHGSSKNKAPLSGPHINVITEESGGALVSWNHVPVQDQMGCILHYRIYWKEQDARSLPEFCEIPYSPSQNSLPINKLHARVTYVLWMTALTASGESPPGNERGFCLQGKGTWKPFVGSSICIAIVIVGIFSTQYFRQKVFVLLSALKPQWCSTEIPDPANSTWAKKYPIVEGRMQLPRDWIPIAWCAPEEPEPLVINEVLQVTPIFPHSQCTNWPKMGRGVQGHFTSKKHIVYSASSLPPSRAVTAETRQLADLYKVLGSRGPDSRPGNPASPLTVLPVDYLPNHEGYLPSNVEELPPQEAPLTDPLEELEPQHISLSIFASRSLHPLTSCGEKLTLDQLKMGCDSLLH
ncbi:interleukin-12 receptor subunit beta-2 isoform X1 [Perognathus longimembris pacificus]|uniref:interleukin-12 receptor subunit beta-2 isoform X1 n=1 Tax=Perognathus longimembris pacificus TaxID=214514 RepID=UPI0020194DB3|nr:interleukin-12 receptor subunit beta-2 isoform X1 [Perognathus longimembris pacificus]